MSQSGAARDPYLIKSVVHASRLIGAFQAPGEVLRLADLVDRTSLSRGIVFRLLYTLERCGAIDKTSTNQYRLAVGQPGRRRWKIGYAASGNEDPFVREVSDSLRFAAEHNEEIEFFMLDNRLSATTTIRNADRLVREHVHLAIEYQCDDLITAQTASKFNKAGIPVIAINNPLPRAFYFGADNYAAGLMGGRSLGRWSAEHWGGSVDEILLIDLNRAGAIPRSRLTGTIDGIAEVLRRRNVPVVHLDGDGDYEKSWHAARLYVKSTKARRTLISGINDTSVLGALRAYEEAGRHGDTAAVGQNCTSEAREELRRPGSLLIGSVAYFPDEYGKALIRLCLDILNHRFVPPAVFARHQLLTPKNVDRIYLRDRIRELP